MVWRRLALAACLAAPVGLAAQDRPGPVTDSLPIQGPLRSPVLTVDLERLFAESAYGRRAAAILQADSEALAAENAEIIARLQAEEQDLTARRPTMEARAFRAEADAFDARVQAIRADRDARERDLQTRLSTARDEFIVAATPILGEIMLGAGAAVMLDRRNVLLGVGLVDVTDQAIERIDDELGDGADADPVPLPDEVQPPPDPSPEPEQDPESSDPIDLAPAGN